MTPNAFAERLARAQSALRAAGAQTRSSERMVMLAVPGEGEALGDTDSWSLVASGPNSALPHHHTSDRVLAERDVLLLDLGASHAGYQSDITRTNCLGEPSAAVARAFAQVSAARPAGITAARTGATGEQVDAAARAVFVAAGVAEHFVHRSGHGLGLEVHELPYLVQGNTQPLAANMVHSVEPGLYFPGEFGIRPEDIVVLEADGERRLNQAPFDLRVPGLRT